ncbi:MAG: hypothetical protein J1D85_05310 [Bacteroidales bacterium]|nr:hypothetical protein [Bacteroidales bacterium]
MKKAFAIFVSILMGIALFAQGSIDGTWIFSETENKAFDESGGNGKLNYINTMTFKFSGDGYTMKVSTSVQMDLNGEGKDGTPVNAVFNIKVSGSNGGKFSRDGNRLTLTPAKGSKPQVDVDADVQGVPGGSLMKSMISGPIKKEFNEELKRVQNFRIVSLSQTELTLEDILTEKEIKKGEKPETMVLTRQ